MDGMLTALVDRVIARCPRTGPPLLWLRSIARHGDAFHCFFHLLGALTSIRRHPRCADIAGRHRVGRLAEYVSVRRRPGLLGFWAVRLRGLCRASPRKTEGNSPTRSGRSRAIWTPCAHAPEHEPESAKLLEKLAKLPATRGNHAELLIDGEATFDSIFEGIAPGARIRARAVLHHPRRRPRPAVEGCAHRQGARGRPLLCALR